MEDKVTVFSNDEFGNVRTFNEDGKILFCAKDIATILGYSNPRDAVKTHCRGVVKHDGVSETKNQHGIITKQITTMSFIPEGDVYRLIVRSKLPGAERFESWVFDEVIPSIRKNGIYATPVTIESMIANPDFAIKLLTELKEEQDKRKKLEEEVRYKEDVIIGLVDNIDLAEKRQRINQIIRHQTKDFNNISKKWNMLYSEFEKKYHVNLNARLIRYGKEFKPKFRNRLDVIDRQLKMIPQLYEICCKLFENDVKALIQEWENTVSI